MYIKLLSTSFFKLSVKGGERRSSLVSTFLLYMSFSQNSTHFIRVSLISTPRKSRIFLSSGTLSWTPDIVLSLLPDMELSPGARSRNGQLGRHPPGPSPRSRFSRCGCFQEQTFQSCCSAVSVACAYLVT